jgi:hypothetical protein
MRFAIIRENVDSTSCTKVRLPQKFAGNSLPQDNELFRIPVLGEAMVQVFFEEMNSTLDPVNRSDRSMMKEARYYGGLEVLGYVYTTKPNPDVKKLIRQRKIKVSSLGTMTRKNLGHFWVEVIRPFVDGDEGEYVALPTLLEEAVRSESTLACVMYGMTKQLKGEQVIKMLGMIATWLSELVPRGSAS